MRILVLATDPVDAGDVRAALPGEDDLDGSEVLVVAPAVNESPLAFWVSDSDEAIADAESAAQRTAEALAEGGARTRATTGESEPLVAVQDALATFPADRIVIFSHPESDRDYREDKGLADAEAHFGVPVTHALIER